MFHHRSTSSAPSPGNWSTFELCQSIGAVFEEELMVCAILWRVNKNTRVCRSILTKFTNIYSQIHDSPDTPSNVYLIKLHKTTARSHRILAQFHSLEREQTRFRHETIANERNLESFSRCSVCSGLVGYNLLSTIVSAFLQSSPSFGLFLFNDQWTISICLYCRRYSFIVHATSIRVRLVGLSSSEAAANFSADCELYIISSVVRSILIVDSPPLLCSLLFSCNSDSHTSLYT